MFKKITISLMLALTLLFTCLPISALADETTTASTAAEEETVDATPTADQEDHKEDTTPAESAEAAEEGESSVNEEGLISVYTEDGEEETEPSETVWDHTPYENYRFELIVSVPDGFTDDIELLFQEDGGDEIKLMRLTKENGYTNTIDLKADQAFEIRKDSYKGQLYWADRDEKFYRVLARGTTAFYHHRLRYEPEEAESESESESAVITIGSETEGEPVTETKNTNPFLNFMSGFGSFILNNLVLLLIIAGGFGYLIYRKKKNQAEIKETIEEDKKDDTYIE